MSMQSYNFSLEFQDAILACLIRYPEEFYGFGEIIKPEYFTGSAPVEVIFGLNDYRKQYNQYPTFSVLANFVFTKMARANPDRANELIEYVDKISQIDTSEKQAILDLSIKFARERAVYDAIRRIHAAQTEGKINELDPLAVMQEAMAVGTNYNDLGISLRKDSDKYLDMVTNPNYGVMTGYAPFDELWKNGWGPGWLIVLLAPPKRWKTTMSINLALNIAKKQDVDVLYYACEISQELAALRAVTNITGWSQDAFHENPEQGKLVAKNKLNKQLWGDVWFKGYPSKSTAISEIRAHARQTIALKKLKPKAIIIDYAETVKPDSAGKDSPDWRQQADIYTQARALGHEFGCCVIMPDRCNKETVAKKVPNMKSFQGAFEKAGIVDVAIGICSSDEEYLLDTVRYFVFLNRHGAANKHYRGKVDPIHMKMTVDKEIDYVPDDEDDVRQSRRNDKNHTANHMAMKNAGVTQQD